MAIAGKSSQPLQTERFDPEVVLATKDSGPTVARTAHSGYRQSLDVVSSYEIMDQLDEWEDVEPGDDSGLSEAVSSAPCSGNLSFFRLLTRSGRRSW